MNSILRRRRALMAEAGQSDVLWQIKNQIIDGGKIASDVKLCETDMDWSVVVDVDIDSITTSNGDASQFRLVNVPNEPGTTFSLRLYKHSSGNPFCQYMGSYQQIAYEDFLGRTRCVIYHQKNSGKAVFKTRLGSNAVVTNTITVAFTSSSKGLAMGTNSGSSQLPKGTINEATIYNRVLSSAEINEFLGVQ